MATKWKGDPLTDKHVPSLYLEPSNTLSQIAPSVSGVTSGLVSRSQYELCAVCLEIYIRAGRAKIGK